MCRFYTVMARSSARLQQPDLDGTLHLSAALARVWSDLARLCDAASAPFTPTCQAQQAWERFAQDMRRALAREGAVLPQLMASLGVRDDRPRLRHAHHQLLTALDETTRLRQSGKLEAFVDAMHDLMTRMVAHDVWQRRCVAPTLEQRLAPTDLALAIAQLTADPANDH
jgi:hypothetical protein